MDSHTPTARTQDIAELSVLRDEIAREQALRQSRHVSEGQPESDLLDDPVVPRWIMKRSRVVVCGGGAQDRPLKLHIPGRALRDRGQLLAHQQAPRKVQIGNSQGLQSVPQS